MVICGHIFTTQFKKDLKKYFKNPKKFKKVRDCLLFLEEGGVDARVIY